MLHDPTIYNPNNVSEVKQTIILQSRVYLQHLLVLSHLTSAEFKRCNVITPRA